MRPSVRADLLFTEVLRALCWPEGATAAALGDRAGASWRAGRMRGVPKTWRAREVALVLPIALARAMWPGVKDRVTRRKVDLLTWQVTFLGRRSSAR